MKDEIRGCVYAKSGRYYGRIYYYENGTRKEKNFSTGVVVDKSTPKKAKQSEVAAQRALSQILSSFTLPCKAAKEDKRNQLFSDAAKEWMEHQYGAKAPSTVAGYQYCVDDIVLYFTEVTPVRVADITSTVVEDYLAWERLRRHPGYNGPFKKAVKYKDLSGVENTVSHRAAVLRAILQKLKRDGIIVVNVASKRDSHVNLPRVQQHVFDVLTPEEADEFIAQLKNEPLWFKVAVLLALLLGLRRSEVIGLREVDFDLKTRKLVVRCVVTEQVGPQKKKEIIAKIKTKNSKVKQFDLTDELAKCFDALQQENRKNEKLFGSSYDQAWKGYFFRDKDGKLIEPDVLTKHFSKFANRIGNKNLRYHDLRHSCASILHANGVSLRTVQEILGHSQLSTTIMYTHLYAEEKSQAVNYMTDRFLKSSQNERRENDQNSSSDRNFDRNFLET